MQLENALNVDALHNSCVHHCSDGDRLKFWFLAFSFLYDRCSTARLVNCNQVARPGLMLLDLYRLTIGVCAEVMPLHKCHKNEDLIGMLSIQTRRSDVKMLNLNLVHFQAIHHRLSLM